MAAGRTGAARRRVEDGTGIVGLRPDAPGWHVTTGPGVLLYPTANGEIGGNFSLEAEIFLFPGEAADEYGIFLGGQDIDTSAMPDYSAFVLRRDGQAAVLRRRGGQSTALAAWQRHEAIVPGKAGDEPVKNILKVDVDATNVTLWVNAAKVLRSRGPTCASMAGWLPRWQGHEPAHHDAERDAEVRAGAGQEGIGGRGLARPREVVADRDRDEVGADGRVGPAAHRDADGLATRERRGKRRADA